ncbi:hypothetical protein [Natronosalvus vescus]|uniref:hypothetical protein n=1 Tax=Natronosalvus vescus TaxID=2953881 RepID=UPI00209121B4|nr:hypothetical protein [Natronosalvus vescus]
MATHTSSADSSRVRPSSLGGVALVVASIVLSVTSYGSLGSTVRIRWTYGTYHHYGPEYLSTLPVLVAFPVLVAVLYLCTRWILEYVRQNSELERFDEFRTIYDIFVLLILGGVVTSQLIIIVLNL